MNRYIDADALKSQKEYCEERHEYIVPVAKIDWMPTADVAPVVHAKWDVNGHCTNCGGHAPFYCMTSTYYKSPYCFECGAKIDGEDGNS